MTTFNPAEVKKSVLAPCHSLIAQFHVDNGKLSLFVYNRSSDIILGLPFNIASSALLLCTVAKATGTIASKLHMTCGNIHLYETHLEAAKEQIKRIPLKFPVLTLPELDNKSPLEYLESLTRKDLKLEKYKSRGKLKNKAIMVA